jgi:hypothetical protein
MLPQPGPCADFNLGKSVSTLTNPAGCTPLFPLNDPATGQIEVEDNFTSDGALQLIYIGDEAEGLRLNPFFPGQLSFRPADGIAIPLDPLAAEHAAMLRRSRPKRKQRGGDDLFIPLRRMFD